MIELLLMLSIVFFIALYFIIKTAVTKAIDSAIEIKLLKAELRELNKQLKQEKLEKNNSRYINEKV